MYCTLFSGGNWIGFCTLLTCVKWYFTHRLSAYLKHRIFSILTSWTVLQTVLPSDHLKIRVCYLPCKDFDNFLYSVDIKAQPKPHVDL
jgi:hypothetical protein